jgi:HPt (histidine-containing phosphotransfer) domain-containing protein
MSAIDPQALRRLAEDTGSDDAALQGMLDEFAAEAARVAGELRQAIQEARWPQAARAAHTLKGLAATFGAAGLAQACKALEARCQQGMATPAELALAEAELARVQAELAARGAVRAPAREPGGPTNG